jgi:ribonuclease HII
MKDEKVFETLEITHTRDLLACNSNYIIGVDEVGTGAWAGPVVVGAVVLPSNWSSSLVKDSKQYKNHNQRRSVYRGVLKEHMLHAETLSASAADIDDYGLHVVLDSLISRLVERAQNKYPEAIVVVDGNRLSRVRGPAVALPKADAIVPAVSAASILAKIDRDTIMRSLHVTYPNYCFDTAVGYGTKAHELALKQYGICPEHRKSFRPIQRIVSGLSVRDI